MNKKPFVILWGFCFFPLHMFAVHSYLFVFLYLACLFSPLRAGAAPYYSPPLALSALYYSKTAYCEADEIAAWKCEPCGKHPQFSDVRVHTNSSWETQGFMGYDSQANQVVVAFRGSASLVNWWENLKFLMTEYPFCDQCEVHRGFYQEYMNQREAILSGVKTLIARHPGTPVLVTGHSLGATIALLISLDIIRMAGPVVTLYTFGEPRVGNPDFAAYANKMTARPGVTTVRSPSDPIQYRLVHARDPVPHVPMQILGYLHAPREVWYAGDDDTNYTVCSDTGTSEDDDCSNSIYPISIFAHTQYLGICTRCTCTLEDAKRLEREWALYMLRHGKKFLHMMRGEKVI